MWLELPPALSILAVESDLGRPEDVYATVPSPHMVLVMLSEAPNFRAFGSVMT